MLSNCIVKDVTSKIANATLTGSIEEWTRTSTPNRYGTPKTNTYATEIYKGCGSLIQTIYGLKKGLYKFSVQGFYRDGSNEKVSEYTDAGYNLSCCFIGANGYNEKIMSWGIDRTSNDTPNSMETFSSLAEQGKYTNDVYTYVDDSGVLSLEIKYPQYIEAGWFIAKNATLTYYTLENEATEEERKSLDDAIQEALATINNGGTKGLEQLNSLINQAKTIKDDREATTEQVNNIKDLLLSTTYQFAFDNASKERPLNVSKYINNPSFEGYCESKGNTFNVPEDWTINATAEGWRDGAIKNANPSDGKKIYNLWAGQITSLDIYQDITLPQGKYTLAADFRIDNTNDISNQGTYAQIGEQIYKTDSIIKYVAPTWESKEGWNRLPVTFNVIDNNSSVRIGASSSGEGTNTKGWFQIDNFTLTYLGNEEIIFKAINIESPATAGQWYKTNIDVESDYRISISGNNSNIYYTQNGEIISLGEANKVQVNDGNSFEANLKVGTLYIYSSENVSISINPKSFSYELGDVLCNKTNDSYIKDGTIIFTFPNATTNDATATLTLNNEKKASVNGEQIDINAVEGGFSINIEDFSQGTQYNVTIPANTFGYEGKAENNELNYTFHTHTFADGKYYLFNVESGKWLGAGNDWGTSASLCNHGQYFSLEGQNDGKYNINSYVSNGGNSHYLGINLYVDENATSWFITKNNDYYVISMDNNKFIGYNGSSTSVTGELTSTDNAAQWKIYSESQMKEMLRNATYDNPVDATFLIQDPCFGRNDQRSSAWETYKSDNNLNISNNDNWSFYACEAWNNTFYVKQSISDIPNGLYQLSVQGYDSGKNAYLFANEEKDTIKNHETAANFKTAAENIGKGMYTGTSLQVYVNNGTLTFGIQRDKVISEAPWCVFSNFELKYLGDVKTAKLNISKENKWATFYASFDVDLPANVYSYAITVVDNSARRVKIGGDQNYTLPAETPVLMYTDNDEGYSHTFIEGTAKGEPVVVNTINYLVGTEYDLKPMPTTTEGNTNYILMKNKTNGVSWFKVSEGINSLRANRAYLSIAEGVEIKALFEDEETAISTDYATKKNANNIFNIAGQKLNNTQKSGIYIINGKKQFVK